MANQIYVACLAAYNNGKLHGDWIDCDQKDSDAIYEEIQKILKSSPEKNAEEYAIHDYELPFEIGEYTPIKKIVDLLEATEKNEVIPSLMSHLGIEKVCDAIDYHEENFSGEYDSLEDWAYQILNDSGELDSLSDLMKNYFDFEKYAKDAEYGGDIFSIEKDGKYFVYWSR